LPEPLVSPTSVYPSRAYPHLWVSLMRTSLAIAALAVPAGELQAATRLQAGDSSPRPLLRVLQGGARQEFLTHRQDARRAGTTRPDGQADGWSLACAGTGSCFRAH